MTPRSWIRQLFTRTPRAVRKAPARSRPRLYLEALEDRLAPATFTVINLNDAGPGSLRQAVLDANSTAGPELINFQSGLTGTITLTSGQLFVSQDLTINGPGADLLTVSGNHASRVFELSAGGTHNFTFSGLTIANGSSDFGGGMDFAFTSGTLTIQSCVFSGNNASQVGGGLQVFGNSSATTVDISNTTFTNNQAAFAAAVDLGNATATLTNCTISGNTSTVFIGAVAVLGANPGQTSDLTLTNCTIAANSGPGVAGLAAILQGGATSATARYVNTIFANSAGGAPNVGAFGAGASVTSLGHNLSDDGSGNLTAAGDQPSTDPLLAPLGNYGGPEPTMALLPGSPAIDAGTGAPATDQRGVGRVGAVDVGAFESRGFTLGISGGNNQHTPINTAFGSALAVAVASPFGEPVQGGKVTFTAPGSGAGANFPGGNVATVSAAGQASVPVFANGSAGNYGVTAAAAGASAVAFSLTNDKGTPTLTWSNPAAISYGTALSGTQLNAGASVPGTFTYSPAAGTVLTPGNQPLSVSFTPTDTADYTTASQSVTISVTPATLTATGVSFGATAGAPFSGAVATFTNADPFGGAGTYSAQITWGDGSTSAGVISGTGSTLTVSGSHTYADPVNETVQVTISHNLGYTTPATTTATATVTSLGQNVVNGLTGTIGFWHNQNGQALIQSFNGGAWATALSTWLAAAFPNLYGSGAGANNLTGMTNAQVVAYDQTLFGLGGAKAQAQVLAVALNVYATTASLGGNAQAAADGFTVSAVGLAAYSFNVGTDGAAFGVANNTTQNVYELLQAVNRKAKNGLLYGGDATLQSECADLFTALNNAGDIG
jgi:hypothetical protein